MTREYKAHYSVLYNECIEALKDAAGDSPAPLFADMTFGAGGHSSGLAKVHEKGICYSVDQDPDALENGYKLIKDQGLEENLILTKMNFEEFPSWINDNHSEKKFNGILMDLGVSSHHFDKFDRGFSFREDAPLDMRMDHHDDSLATAAEILNEVDEETIANLIFKYGEERLSRRIAKNICEFREKKPIETTKELEEIVFLSYPKNQRHKKTHPATKTFQALRIVVNRELEVLENTIEGLYELLAPGGVLAIISFHSLEDRIAKHKFKEIVAKDKYASKILTKKPIYPSEKELEENPRSRSSKLRLLQKI